MKSSGRDSLARWPLEAVTSSPFAKRYASAGPSLHPNAPASIENEVWTWVSPKNGRVGKLRPAYGEYGGLAGKASLADVSSSVPTSVMGCSAANDARAKPMIEEIKMVRYVCFISVGQLILLSAKSSGAVVLVCTA